jgi:hypothetical protein
MPPCNPSQRENRDLEYQVRRRRNGSQLRLTRQGRELTTAWDEGELLFILEKELTIELQKIRHELYFRHAVALSLAGQAFLIVARSGTGIDGRLGAFTSRFRLFERRAS